ncbi:FliM/FliN family flagellar motor C-terminal domain-containing protein [Roseobacter sp. GAI101]|uniref:FliM/FliN family flagellar motor C-terminal domain-containing protein n=1 Tax=Roseobacter sp. (strain GAI101) TaxID=391589 RepID=UPI0001871F8A|nr:FliM/FliN family flagellar motor C-terminal domain-containing protein [Roseobacter sp. GAI101]EEB83185.1 Surface presentation of antigens protein [Roseobacter sp. GAI101]
MTDQLQSAMRRKTQAGQALHQSRTVSVPKALRLTLSKVGNDLFSLPLATMGVTQHTVDNEECRDILKDENLLILMDGPRGLCGAVMIDPALVGGLIQQQTMGKVLDAPAGFVRPMTGTDAALAAPLIDALLERAAKLVETDEDRAVLTGYRFGAKSHNVRLLMLSLDAPEFHIIRMTVDMAQGARQGELVLCLPVPPRHAVAAPTSPDAGSAAADPVAPRTLSASVLQLKAELMVSLAQVTMSIRDAGGLHVGQVLPLGSVSFDAAQVRTKDGRILGVGSLGQSDGMRAMRLKHRVKTRDAPKRRAADVGELAAQGAYDASFEAIYDPENLPALEHDGGGIDASDWQSDAPQMPDISDLPEMSQMADFSAMEGMSETPEMAEMPDMSDLPGFEDGFGMASEEEDDGPGQFKIG